MSAAAPTSAPTSSRKDRFIARLVAFINRWIYREVDVHWTVPPPDGPLLSVSNHFGGLSDALVLLEVFPRRPGIVARDVIWKIPVVGSLMKIEIGRLNKTFNEIRSFTRNIRIDKSVQF